MDTLQTAPRFTGSESAPQSQVVRVDRTVHNRFQLRRFLGGRFGYLVFFLLEGGEGGVRGARKGAGVGSLLKMPGGGRLPGEGGG